MDNFELMAGITNTSNTVADKLDDLITSKSDMKSAIIRKGVTPTGGLSTYADAIRDITVSGSSIIIPDGARFCNSHFTTIPSLVVEYANGRNDINVLFRYCSDLVSFPRIDTSNMTIANGMFEGCESLTTVDYFDTSRVTSMAYMFKSCYSLQTIPRLNTIVVNNMSYMFWGCGSLQTIPQLNTSSVTKMIGMFSDCVSLTDLPLLDFGSLREYDSIFNWCYQLTNIGGFKNFGEYKGADDDLALYSSPMITRQSMLNIFNNLYDRAVKGYSTCRITLHTDVMNRLTDNDIMIATNKGFIIAA